MARKISKALKRYNSLFVEMQTAYHEISLKLGLSDSAMFILYAILDSGDPCLLRDICYSTGLRKQTVNSALRKLEMENVLHLELIDGKNKIVHLTEKGKTLADRTAGRVFAIEDEIFASWPQADVQKYLELTENFMLALQEKSKNLQEADNEQNSNPII